MGPTWHGPYAGPIVWVARPMRPPFCPLCMVRRLAGRPWQVIA